jgi:hypothetical protein
VTRGDYHQGVTDIVRAKQPEDDIDQLRARVAELDATLAGRVAEIDRIESELAAFKIRYRQDVGLLHEELDELEHAIDEAERGELAKQVASGAREAGTSPGRSRSEPQPRYTSDGVRKLFRDVAKAIHPDLARDEHAWQRRHSLMIEANRAYALGDEERLRSILHAWESSPDAVHGTDEAATRLRLARCIAQVDEQLVAYAGALGELKDSPLWKLKTMVDDAAGRGKDLVGDMVRRLKRDIAIARNRLDAIHSRS